MCSMTPGDNPSDFVHIPKANQDHIDLDTDVIPQFPKPCKSSPADRYYPLL